MTVLNKLWTKEEVELLTSIFPSHGIKKSAKILNRTESATARKASRLGLKSKAHCMTHEQYENKLFEREINYIPLEKYVNTRTKILHECIEGHTWKIEPHYILAGNGCPTCALISRTRSDEEYQSIIAEKGLFSEPYISANTKITHYCDKGHTWDTWPSHILAGKSCPSCANYGFDPDKPAILYYIKVTKDNETYYKIGITNRTVEKRFSPDKDKIIINLSETYYEKGSDARDAEILLLNKFKDKRVTVQGFLKSEGNTELFLEDVLELDP